MLNVATSSEPRWDDLLDYIEAGCIIPIVGRSLLTHPVGGEELGFHEHLARGLAKELGLTQAESSGRQGLTLNGVACSYLAQGGRLQEVYPALWRITKREESALPIPEPLLQLAEISSFKLFVTTTFDSYLTRAIDQVRHGGEPRTRTLAYAPRGASREEAQDLDRFLAQLKEPVVYHLLGRLSPVPHEYAVTDEDVLELIYSLQARERIPKSLFQELTAPNHQLLILGCSFSGWLARFFIRIAKGQPLFEARKLDTVVDPAISGDNALVLFLRYFSEGTLVIRRDAREFVAELHRRWQDRHPAAIAAPGPELVPAGGLAAIPASMPSGAVFISYANEDTEAARAIKDALDKAGIDVWFDKSALQGGDEFEQVITRQISKASVFLPIVSKQVTSLERRFFWREWRAAIDVAKNVPPGQRFIVPVAIDDIPPDTEALRTLFGGYHWERAPHGRPTPEFVHSIRELFRSYQKWRSGAV